MAAPLLHGLPPIIGEGAQTLILGNMLSVMSVASQQYYGNPRNAFWRITGELFGFAADDPYDERASALRSHGIAVWDVLKSCRRAGSLDSAVEPDSMVPNDFGELFDAHRGYHTRVLQRSGGRAELQPTRPGRAGFALSAAAVDEPGQHHALRGQAGRLAGSNSRTSITWAEAKD